MEREGMTQRLKSNVAGQWHAMPFSYQGTPSIDIYFLIKSKYVISKSKEPTLTYMGHFENNSLHNTT